MKDDLIEKRGTMEKMTGISLEQIGQLSKTVYRMLYPCDGDEMSWTAVRTSVDYDTYRNVPAQTYPTIEEEIQGFHITLGDDKEKRGRLDLELRDGKAEYRIGLEPMSTTDSIPTERFERIEEMIKKYII